MGRPRLDEDLSAGAPDHDDAVDLLVFAEPVDVLADPVQHRPLADVAHGVLALEVAGVLALERSGHRADVAQRVGDRLDVLAGLEDAGA